MDWTIKFFKMNGEKLTGAEMMALPVGTHYIREINGTRQELVR
jgi:hypothetical protein